MNRSIFESDHELFRASVREFVEREVSPNVPKWEEQGIVDKEMFRKAGQAGLLGMAIPEEWGGGGVDDFRFNVVVVEELIAGDAFASGMCITLHNDVVTPYFLNRRGRSGPHPSRSRRYRRQQFPGLPGDE